MFRAMFSLDMKEKEASEIEVGDVTPETLAQMIEFMYTGNVNDLDERADELLGKSAWNSLLLGMKRKFLEMLRGFDLVSLGHSLMFSMKIIS